MFIPGSAPGSPRSQRVPWNISDTLAGVICLLLLTVALSLALGSFVRFADDGLDTETLLFIVGALGAVSGAGVVARFVRASRALMTRVVVVTLLAMGVIVAVSSGDGIEREMFGLPVQFYLTLAVIATTVTVVLSFTVGKYRSPWSTLGFNEAEGRYRTLGAFGIWFAGLFAIGLIDQMLRLVDVEVLTPPDNASEALDSFGGHLVPALFAVGLLVPVAEEMFFRGFVLPALRNRVGVVAAVLISSILFALFHVDPGLYLPTFILGLALGSIRVWTGSLWPSIMVHMAQNTMALILASQSFDIF